MSLLLGKVQDGKGNCENTYFTGLRRQFTSIYKILQIGKTAYKIPLLKGGVIVADRFYNDFSLLNVWDSNEVFFVIRHKENLQFSTIKENELPENRHPHILSNIFVEILKTW